MVPTQNQLLGKQLPWLASSRHRERSRLVNYSAPSWIGNSVWQNMRQDTTEHVQDSVKVAALKRMMTAEMADRHIEGPSTYPELRRCVAAHVGEKMIRQSYAPMDVGEVEEEVEGSDNQIDELRGTRKPRRDERSTHERGPGKQPWKVPSSGRHEKRETDNRGRIT